MGSIVVENESQIPSGASSRIAAYRELSKSGIVALVLISVLGGYFIGHPPELAFDWGHLFLTLAGVMLLASGSSALNQLQEISIDARMPRTSARPLPSGRLSTDHALRFIGMTLFFGLMTLAVIGPQVVVLGIAAVILYNGLYTMWWKRRWAFAAVPGAVPGALPILMGYAAASGQVIHPAGLYLFFLLFYWQMPHFWVLALRYEKDYAQGGIPTLPVVHGEGPTLYQIVLWCLAYIALAIAAPVFLGVGGTYLLITLPVCGKILWELRAFVKNPQSRKWLHFFLWVNFSLIAFIAAAAVDLWGVVYVLPLIR